MFIKKVKGFYNFLKKIPGHHQADREDRAPEVSISGSRLGAGGSSLSPQKLPELQPKS
ncbi:MAG: hypothetical protein PHU44_14885 [Syntrophales bacterium]|nr:hypothetical protein [Syntrophales bacterium]MDD5643002.1 hypothetical protein [Syntrophales bacterium]